MKRILTLLVLTLCVCLPAPGQKSNMKQLESQRAQLEKDIAVLNRQLAQNAKNSSAAMNNLSLVRSKISAREKLIAGYDQTLRLLTDSIRVVQAEIDRLPSITAASSAELTKTATAAFGTCTCSPARMWVRLSAASATCAGYRPK